MEEASLLVQEHDVLELDEMRPFVLKKADKRRLWTAIRRRTRQIAAYALGDRSEASRSIPESYRTCRAFSDFWSACSATHSGVGKKTGQDCSSSDIISGGSHHLLLNQYQNFLFLGIDVAKAGLDMALPPQDGKFRSGAAHRLFLRGAEAAPLGAARA